MNLTIAVDPAVLERARARARSLGTSVNEVLRRHLEAFAGGDSEREGALRELLALSDASRSRRAGRAWSRDELHVR